MTKDEQIFSFAWDKIYKKELFNDIRYPDNRIYEDIATTYKVFHNAKFVFHINKAFYYYVRREGSICCDTIKEILRAQHRFKSFYERYIFVKTHMQYSSVFHKCEYDAFKVGLKMLHYCIKSPNLVEKKYFHQLLLIMRQFNILRNPFMETNDKIEYRTLSFFGVIYKMFLKSYFFLE